MTSLVDISRSILVILGGIPPRSYQEKILGVFPSGSCQDSAKNYDFPAKIYQENFLLYPIKNLIRMLENKTIVFTLKLKM